MRTLAVVQARMSSTRLPGKTLAPIGGEPLLALLIRRLQRARSLERVIIATSDQEDDRGIVECARSLGVEAHQGPLDDVLARMAGAVHGFDGAVVRITADCPLLCAAEVDKVVALFERTPGCDYASNIEPRSVPDGCDVEVIASAILVRLDCEVGSPEAREHVTTWLRDGTWHVTAAAPPAHPGLAALRWTVDEPGDLEFVRAVVERLGASRYDAGIDEILLAARAEPDLSDIGGHRRV